MLPRNTSVTSCSPLPSRSVGAPISWQATGTIERFGCELQWQATTTGKTPWKIELSVQDYEPYSQATAEHFTDMVLEGGSSWREDVRIALRAYPPA